eukprot:scaffold40010_cov58-Phaeocystis_antarctica.AAC.4
MGAPCLERGAAARGRRVAPKAYYAFLSSFCLDDQPTWAIRGGRQVNVRVFSRVFRAEVNTFGIRTYSGTSGGSSEQG